MPTAGGKGVLVATGSRGSLDRQRTRRCSFEADALAVVTSASYRISPDAIAARQRERLLLTGERG
jgi:hypothetical protein